MNGRYTTGVVYRHFYHWFVWKVAAPFCFLVLIWFAYSLRGDMPDAFGAAFAHGELLVFAAVLLIEVSFEGEELRGLPPDRFDAWFDGALPVFKLLALLIICTFGFIRYDVVSMRAQLDSKVKDVCVVCLEQKLSAYAVLNMTIALASVTISFFSCFKHCEHELQRRLETLTT